MKKGFNRKNKSSFSRLYRFFGITILFLSVISCKKQEQPVYSFFPDQTRRLTVYSALNPKLTEVLAGEFEYITGIWVQSFSGSTDQVREKILSVEGEETGDVLLCCASDAISVFSDFLSPYVKNNSLIQRPYGQKNLVTFGISPVGYLYNIDYFKETAKFDLYQELQSSEKLSILNPFLSTENFTCLYYLYSTTLSSNLKAFNRLFDSFAEACDSVAEGFSSAILMPENYALQFMDSQPANRTAFFLPPQSNVIINSASILKSSKSKDNAERFVAFLQSREAQNYLTAELKYRPVRRESDISPNDQKMLQESLGNTLSDAVTLNEKKNSILLQWIIKNGGPQK